MTAETVRDIDSNVLRRYLETHGWTGQSFADRKIALFTLEDKEGGENVEIVLPTGPMSSRMETELVGALRTLSQLLGRSIDEVAQDVRSLAFDVLRSKIPNEYVRNESIELRLATKFIEGMKALFTSAATTELNPGRYYERKLKEAKAYAGHCRFGHTFRGSFGFLIESRVGLNDEPSIDGAGPAAPFPRRVVERIARGLATIEQAAAAEDPSQISSRYTSGLSANMCEDLIDVIEGTGVTRLGMQVEFSPEWRTPNDLQQTVQYSVELRHADLLRDAAKALRRQDVAAEVEIVGRVKRLETEGNPADLFDVKSTREIIVNWDSADHGIVRVQVLLPPEEYMAAVEAHKSGRQICIRGLLEHHARTWTLQRPRDLKILPT
jgi:hypothetical protein